MKKLFSVLVALCMLISAAAVAESVDAYTTASTTEKEGTTTAQIMSINSDGSVGLSTISEWKYEAGKAYVRLTAGQNALNLAQIGATGTLLVKGQGPTYLLHLKTIEVVVLEYSEETAGQFDQHYSGAANALNEYDITFEVSTIEQSFALMF